MARTFRVIHPFHPLRDREFELIERRNCWGSDRVWWVDGSGRVRSLPAAWTSEAEEDAFVAVSGGRSAFRPEDLLALADLLAGMAEEGGSGVVGSEVDVNRITPS